MVNRKTGIDQPTGASILDYGIEAPTPTIEELVEGAGFLKNQTMIASYESKNFHQTTKNFHGKTLLLLNKVATKLAKISLIDLLEQLRGLGFSWQGIARLTGVSVPALRKWRHGNPATGHNRHRVAMVVAFCQIAKDRYLIDDVAGWLETPIHRKAPITGLDLIAEERYDLALDMASNIMQDDPERILDRVEPDWREKYRSRVKVFSAPDGLPGLRLTEE